MGLEVALLGTCRPGVAVLVGVVRLDSWAPLTMVRAVLGLCVVPIRVASKRVSFVFHTFNTRIFLCRIQYAYDTVVRQDLTFSAAPMKTGSAAHP